jgi:hypothetical protein
MSDINLIPARVRERAAVRRRIGAWSAAASGYALALLGACGVVHIAGGQEQSRLETDGGRLSERYSRAEATLDVLRKQVTEHRQRLEASETVGVHPDWSVLMRALTELRGEDIMLQVLDVQAVEPAAPEPEKDDPKEKKTKGKPRVAALETYRLTVRGHGLSQGGVMGFVRRLEALSVMRDVRLTETRTEPHLGVAAVWFEVRCEMRERADAGAAAAGAFTTQDTETSP